MGYTNHGVCSAASFASPTLFCYWLSVCESANHVTRDVVVHEDTPTGHPPGDMFLSLIMEPEKYALRWLYFLSLYRPAPCQFCNANDDLAWQSWKYCDTESPLINSVRGENQIDTIRHFAACQDIFLGFYLYTTDGHRQNTSKFHTDRSNEMYLALFLKLRRLVI